MKLLFITISILLCSCHSKDAAKNNLTIKSNEFQMGNGAVHTKVANSPSVHVNSHGIIDSIPGIDDGSVGPYLYLPNDGCIEFDKNRVAYKCGALDSIEKARHKIKYDSHGSVDTAAMLEGYSRAGENLIIDLDSTSFHGWHIATLPVKAKWLWRSYPAYLDSSFNKD
jgi:hypothetical protein